MLQGWNVIFKTHLSKVRVCTSKHSNNAITNTSTNQVISKIWYWFIKCHMDWSKFSVICARTPKKHCLCLIYFAQGRAIYIQNLARPQPSFVSLGTHIYVASTRTNYLCIASTNISYVNNWWLHAYFQLVLCNLKDCIKVMTKLSKDTVLVLVVSAYMANTYYINWAFLSLSPSYWII